MSDLLPGPLRSLFGGGARHRLAEAVALQLRDRLPDDHIVIDGYAPRDRAGRIAIVIVGRDRLFVVEPRDEEGALLCYQDHWYVRPRDGGPAHPLPDSPSLRARRDVARVRSDLGTGGFLNVTIHAAVLLTRAHAEDVRSSCVPVFSGIDPLVAHLTGGLADAPAPERTQALAGALARNITVATV